jgi:hypothetical protein
VTKAVEAGALKDIGWPKAWRIVGPLREADGGLPSGELGEIPRSLDISGKRYVPFELEADGATLDLTPVALVKPGGRPAPGAEAPDRVPAELVAYCFATVDCPADGWLFVNAAADWWMAWTVDGEPAYNTLHGGNRADARMLTAHTFRLKLSKGPHVLAVMVKPGSKGWSITSAGGFAAGDVGKLHVKYPARGQSGRGREFRAAPALKISGDPADVRAVWLQQVRNHRAALEWIVKTLPGTKHAARARRFLDALGEAKTGN